MPSVINEVNQMERDSLSSINVFARQRISSLPLKVYRRLGVVELTTNIIDDPEMHFIQHRIATKRFLIASIENNKI